MFAGQGHLFSLSILVMFLNALLGVVRAICIADILVYNQSKPITPPEKVPSYVREIVL